MTAGAPGIHLDDRPDHQHAGPGGADEAGQQRAHQQQKNIDPGGSCQIAFKPDVAGDTVQSQQQNNEGEIVVDDTVRSSLQARGDAVLHRKQNDSQNSPESGNQWHVFLPDPGIQDREQRNR